MSEQDKQVIAALQHGIQAVSDGDRRRTFKWIAEAFERFERYGAEPVARLVREERLVP